MSILNKIFKRNVLTINENGNQIELIEKGNEKIITYNKIVYSRIKINNILVNGYWDYFLPLPNFFKSRNKVNILLIGLGAGTIPYQMLNLYNNVRITALDTSNAMIEITKKLIPSNILKKIRLNKIDGIDYINKNLKYFKNFYSLIILDAYIDDKIPEGFYKKDFIEKVHDFLTDDGLFTINFVKTPSNDLNNMLIKLKEYFKVYLLDTGYLSGNIIIICSKNNVNIIESLEGLPDNIKQETFPSYYRIVPK
ncbi:MAG: spermidine synthase [Candidatus Micrarchaeia archaeon]